MFAVLFVLSTVAAVLAEEPLQSERQYGAESPQGRQLPFYGAQVPYPLNAPQFDPYLNPQYPPIYNPNIPAENQGGPGQPQVLYYPAGPGQPFLVNPGNPPGNFLYPQPQPLPPQQQPGLPPIDPEIFRNQPFPQRPVFVAGYPKPAHIPPTDKDAEEIPTDPKAIPPQQPEKKPEKLELDETEPEKPAPPPKNRPKKPIRTLPNLKPGQRFFILNGQPIFSNYPLQTPFQNPETYNNQFDPYLLRHNSFYPQQPPQQDFYAAGQPNYASQGNNFAGPNFAAQVPNYAAQVPNYVPQGQVPNYAQNIQPQQENNERPGVLLKDVLPLRLHDQVVNNKLVPIVLKSVQQEPQSRYFEKGLPLEQFQQQQIPQQEHVPVYEGNVNPGIAFDYYRYGDGINDDNEAVIIDAKYQDAAGAEDSESESVESITEKPAESSVAQAQPAAIALAGPGGVAAAGPRATALAGEGGLAVSSPHATAVAGPSKDEVAQDDKKKQKKETKRQ